MCQEVPGDVTITTLVTDISTDIYRMTGMFAPIEVDTRASIVTGVYELGTAVAKC
jgi:hypothetical protein